MSQEHINKEALFNEVKGSLFEFLMGKRLAGLSNGELDFLNSIDQNYLNVLSQQDRMVRQFYPEMLSFLNQAAKSSTNYLIDFLNEVPTSPRLKGKFSHSSNDQELYEADLLLNSSKGIIPLSLKLNKKNAFVNTKSGGVKSFFLHYFPFIPSSTQEEFNKFVDQEFLRMSLELHSFNDMEFQGDFSRWTKAGKSELPGELEEGERKILKSYYSRISLEIHQILTQAKSQLPIEFSTCLPALMGFSSTEILQLICFHDFKQGGAEQIYIHSYREISSLLSDIQIQPASQTSSVEIQLGDAVLQIRVKPMNKFTTTAIKLNCSVKFKQSSDTD